MRRYLLWCFSFLLVLIGLLLGGCGGDRNDEGVPDAQSTPATAAPLEEPASDAVYYSAPDFLGYAPYEVDLRLPREVPNLDDNEYCRWDLDDGTSMVALSVRKEYVRAGSYEPEWSIHGPEGVIRSGTYTVDVLPYVSISLDRRKNTLPMLPDELRRVSSSSGIVPDDEVVIAGPDGFSFVNTLDGYVRIFLPYGEEMPRSYYDPPLHALTVDYLYVDKGNANLAVYDRATGDLQREIRVWDHGEGEGRIWAIAANPVTYDVFAIVYPDTVQPEPGLIYCWNEASSDLRVLSFPAPERAWHSVAAEYRLMVDTESGLLLLLMQLDTRVTENQDGGVTLRQDERKRLLVLSGEDGKELGHLEIPVEDDLVGDIEYDARRSVVYFATRRSLNVVAVQNPFDESKHLTIPIEDSITGLTLEPNTGEVYLVTFHGYQDDATLHRLNLSNETVESVDISEIFPHASRGTDTVLAFSDTEAGVFTIVSDGGECAVLRPGSFRLERKFPLERTITIGGYDTRNDRLLLFDRDGAVIQFLSLGQDIESAKLGPHIKIPSDCNALQALWEDRIGAVILSCPEKIVLWNPDSNTRTASLDLAGMPFDKSYYTNWLISGAWSDMAVLQVLSGGAHTSPMYQVDWDEQKIQEWEYLAVPGNRDWDIGEESELHVDSSGSYGYISSMKSSVSLICAIDWAKLEPKLVYELDEKVRSLWADPEKQLWLLTDESLLVIANPTDQYSQRIRTALELPENLQEPYGTESVQRLFVHNTTAVLVEPETGDLLLVGTDTVTETLGAEE